MAKPLRRLQTLSAHLCLLAAMTKFGLFLVRNADKGEEGGLSLADVSKNTLILAKIVSNQARITMRETTALIYSHN